MAVAHVTIDFDDGVPYSGNRPVADVVLQGPGGPHGSTWRVQALVDTGADYMHLPVQALQAVGIATTGAPQNRILTAGGTVVMQRVNVDVEIQGTLVNVPCNVLAGAKPLVGRQAIFTMLETAGFSTSEWLLDYWTAAPSSGGP